MNETTLIYILLVVLVLLQIADAVTTVLALRIGGKELNSLMRSLMDRFGAERVTVFVKILFVATVFIACFLWPGYPYWAWSLGVLDVFYTGIVVNNVLAYRKLKYRE